LPGGTGLQSRSIFFGRRSRQHKTIKYEDRSSSTLGLYGAANPSGLAGSGTMSRTQNQFSLTRAASKKQFQD
jgi:hypothetical protein